MNSVEALLHPGVLIDQRYEVLRTLGAGGMGWVLLVRDQRLNNQEVALKLLHPHLANTSSSFFRFKNEVSITRRLSHPSIVQTYDYGQTSKGIAYLSMEYVPGRTLKQLISQTTDPLPTRDIELFLSQIIDALEYAHKRQVIHRDIKPDNILVTDKQIVKVADFGLAQLFRQDFQLTRAGAAVGTPLYMSPEQIQGELITETSDIYSLGIMLYELASGRPPFNGETFLVIAEQHLNTALPSLANTNADDRPNWYIELIKQCTRKSPRDRFQSITEVGEFFYNHVSINREELAEKQPETSLSVFERENRTSFWLRKWVPTVSIALMFLIFLMAVVLIARHNSSFKIFLGSPIVNLEKRTGMELVFLKQLLGINASLNKNQNMVKMMKRGEMSHEDIQILVKGGMNINAKISPDSGNTVLHQMSSTPSRDKGYLKSFAALLEQGANPNAKNNKEDTPLHLAVKYGNPLKTNILLDHLADPNQENNSGTTPLFWAVKTNHIRIAIALILAGADPDATDRLDKTLVHIAAEQGNLAMLRLLFRHGANPIAQDVRGCTPLFTAIGKKIKTPSHKAVIELLIEKTPLEIETYQGINPLEHAISTGDRTAINLINEKIKADELSKESLLIEQEDSLWQ